MKHNRILILLFATALGAGCQRARSQVAPPEPPVLRHTPGYFCVALRPSGPWFRRRGSVQLLLVRK
jgi:hypothetical protein